MFLIITQDRETKVRTVAGSSGLTFDAIVAHLLNGKDGGQTVAVTELGAGDDCQITESVAEELYSCEVARTVEDPENFPDWCWHPLARKHADGLSDARDDTLAA